MIDKRIEIDGDDILDALLKQVREDALREAADACCHPTNVESGGESAICRNRVLALIEKDKTDG